MQKIARNLERFFVFGQYTNNDNILIIQIYSLILTIGEQTGYIFLASRSVFRSFL